MEKKLYERPVTESVLVKVESLMAQVSPGDPDDDAASRERRSIWNDEEMECDPQSIQAFIGPCIGACCYEVGDEVREAMTAAMGDETLPYFNGRSIDLKGLNRRQLELAGVKNIEVSTICTCCSHEQYWSHRYTAGARGVQAGVIVLGRDRE